MPMPIPNSSLRQPLALSLALAFLIPASVSAQNRGGPQGPAVVSPQVAEGRVSFRILAPKATGVKLTGSDIPGLGQGRETDGAHTWIKWREYLHEFAPLLFQ